MILRHIRPLEGGKRFLLELEDGVELRCGPQELLDHALVPGMELDEEAYARLADACALYGVKVKAAELLGRQAMSAGELIRKLQDRGASPEHAEAAAERLKELGVLDEGLYAEQVIRRCTAKGYGRRRAEQELYRRRVPREYWEDALAALPDPQERLASLIRARLGGREPDEAVKKKLGAWLQRQGYGWEEIRSALRRLDPDED